MSEGDYIPEETVYQNEAGEIVPKDAPGKVTKVASRGVPMPMARARELGIAHDADVSSMDDPVEAKAIEAPAENKARHTAAKKRTGAK